MGVHYPEGYELALTQKRGIELAGQKLKPGWEVVLATASVKCDGMDFHCELRVANISGKYLMLCTNVTTDNWLQTFLFCPDKKVFAS